MFDTLFKKSTDLSKIDVNSINTSEQNRLTALKFSQSLLFLADKYSFQPYQLRSFNSSIAKADVDSFVQGYTYLVTNGFPPSSQSSSLPYNNFEEIFADVIHHLSISADSRQIKNYEKIIHLLLLNPNLQLNHKFPLREHDVDKTGIEHIFSMWVAAPDETKKQALANLLVHLIALNPDLTTITPSTKPHCVYILLSLFAYAGLKRFLDGTNLISWTISLVDVLDLVPMALHFTTAISIGYFATLHIMDLMQARNTEGKLAINSDYLIGTFAVSKPFILKGSTILQHMNEEFTGQQAKIGMDYAEDYINRKLLLAKYGRVKAYLSSARIDIRLQLDLEDLSNRYDSLAKPKSLVFEDKRANVCAQLLKRTFNEANFSAISEELKNQDTRAYFLQVYEMAEKGFIKVDLQTMYVMNEAFNQACYSGYKSHLMKETKVLDGSLTFESFQYAIDSLLTIREGLDMPLHALGPDFNNAATELLKGRGNRLNLERLGRCWKWVLQEFDAQYVISEVISRPVSYTAEKKEEDKADLESKLNKGITAYINQALEKNKGLVDSLKFLGGAAVFTVGVLVLLKPAIRPLPLTLIVLYTTNHYYHPQIVGLKECGQKLCFNGCNAGNSIYKDLNNKVGWGKSYLSSYITSKSTTGVSTEVSV